MVAEVVCGCSLSPALSTGIGVCISAVANHQDLQPALADGRSPYRALLTSPLNMTCQSGGDGENRLYTTEPCVNLTSVEGAASGIGWTFRTKRSCSE